MSGMTAYDSWPTVLCACGISFHDAPGNRHWHVRKHHSGDRPASYRMFDQRGEVAREIEFWEQFYALEGIRPSDAYPGGEA